MVNKSTLKKLRLLGAVCACVFGCTTPNAGWAATISVSSSSTTARAFDIDIGNVNDFSSPTNIPTTETLMSSVGNSSNTTNIIYSGNANNTTFLIDMSHEIDMSGKAITSSCCIGIAQTNTRINFTVNGDATFLIDGVYEMSGLAQEIWFHVRLTDITDNVTVFEDRSVSFNTADESFVAGITGDGDTTNVNSGNLVGDFISGHEYSFISNYFIKNADENNNALAVSATATGYSTLSITNVVPIPAAVWLFGSGLLGLIGFARRKA